ncbi:hypothetical protein EF912_18150 [Streptomyces sp. WAC07061]|nr:hypothetical protein EF912_18150 [Streptomyces sp. WAC07061]
MNYTQKVVLALTASAAALTTAAPAHAADPVPSAFGTRFNGHITRTISTIFNFDVRGEFAGRRCSLDFLTPGNPPSLAPGNLPSQDFRSWPQSIVPGNSYTIDTFDCPAGTRIAYQIGSTDTDLDYFVDYVEGK